MNLDNVPDELKSLPDWLTWYYNKKTTGKLEKVPNVGTGEWEVKKLLAYQDALNQYGNYHQDENHKADGVGFVIQTYSNIVGIDIDHVPDNDIPDGIRAILTAAKGCGYIERSVSRNGFHIIGTCTNKALLLELFLKERGNYGFKSPDQKVEMYAGKHYFTVSGYTLYNTFGNIDKAIQVAWEYMTGKPILTSISMLKTAENAHTAMAHSNATNTSNPDLKTLYGANQNAHFTALDLQILQMPAKPMQTVINEMYKKNPAIKNVLECGYDAFPTEWYNTLSDKSPSGIDMRIVGTLVFWLYRYGIAAVTDIIMQSALRDKKEQYWKHTVETAFRGAEKFYGAAIDIKKLSTTDKRKYFAWLNKKKGA